MTRSKVDCSEHRSILPRGGCDALDIGVLSPGRYTVRRVTKALWEGAALIPLGSKSLQMPAAGTSGRSHSHTAGCACQACDTSA